MAKVISDEILKLKIIINGDEAQKRVLDLERANNVLANRINDLKTKERELSRQRNKQPEELAKIRKEIKDLTGAMGENNRKIDEEVKSMNILSLTSDQLKKRIADLSFTMSHMNPNSSAYKEADQEMGKLTSRMKELKTGSSSSAVSLQHLSDKFNQYSGIATAVIAALAGVAFSIQNVIDANNKMADAQTSVVKTTGLTIEQVKELTRAFTEFDTRTSKIDLLKIAEIGGRLGVPKEEIKDFTREVDKAYVALGDSFSGGVEAVAEKLGKIKGLFKETRDESIADAINEIGSAVNELGAAGAASEENMSDFALRIGQLPESLKPTIAETLALGGAFEESGITAERASSGYSKFVRVAAVEAAGFAKVMGLTEKEVKKLINQDPLQFFLKFSEGAKGLEATKLSEILDGLKLNDAETIATIGAASENTDRFRKSIELSNEALTEATSLQSEFDKVNNNSAAIYEKVQKKFSSMFTSETVAKTLNWLIEMFGKLIGVTVEGEEKSGGFNNTLLFLIRTIGFVVLGFTSMSVAMALYNTLIKESLIKNIALEAIEKGRDLRLKLMASFQSLYNLTLASGATFTARIASAIGLQTVATKAQEAAQKRLNATTAANPLMALLTILTLVIAAYVSWKSHIDEVRAAEKKQYEDAHRYQTQQLEILTKGKQAVEQYKDGVANLIAVIKDENATQEMRKKAYEELIKIHPEFMGTVDKEYRETKKLAQVYEELAKQIDLTARMKARSAAKQSVYDENAKLELEYMKGSLARQKEQEERNKLRQQYNYSPERASSAVNMFGSFEEHNKGIEILNQINKNTALINQYNNADKKRIKELQELIKTAEGAQKKLYEQELYALLGMSEQASTATSNYKPLPEKEKKKKKTDEEKAAEKALREYERNRQKILDSAKDYDQKMEELEAMRLAAMATIQKDGYSKERDLIEAEEAKNIADLEKKKVSDSDFAIIRSMIAKEKGEMRKKLQEIEFEWLTENGRLSQLQELESEKTKLKLLALDEKYIKESYKKEEEALQARLKLIERQQNVALGLKHVNEQKTWLQNQGYSEENLRKIRTWEEGRVAIEKFYQQKRLEEQVAYLNKALAEFQVIMATNPISITPDQMKIIEDYKNQIAALLAEITKLKNGANPEDSQLGGKLSSFGGQTDILGLTPDQWTAMFKNTENLSENIQKVGAAIQVMKNMMAMYSEFAAANEAKLLQQYETASQRKQDRLDKQLKAGLITQEQYKKQTLANEKQLERQKALLEYKSAKRQRAMQIAETVANTAQAIMGIWAQFPKADFGIMAGIMSGVVGALGAAKVATIMSQPLPEIPGAEDGFYPVIRKQDNKLFNARRRTTRTGVFSEPTMLVGEQGAGYPELVVTSKTARQIDPAISNAYMREIARVEGFQDGYYKNVKNAPQSSSAESDEIMIKLINSIDTFNETMKGIKDEGLDARIADSFGNGEKIDKMVKSYQELYNKSKH